jgi:polar amino acid transport system substrate-binding protein
MSYYTRYWGTALLSLSLWLVAGQTFATEATKTKRPTLTIGYHEQAIIHYDEILKVIDRAFELAEIDLELRALPGERLIKYAAAGIIDGDLTRVPSATKGYPTLIPIDIPLLSTNLWVWVSNKQQCPARVANLPDYRPVDVLGFQFYKLVGQTSRVGVVQVSTPVGGLKMVQSGRADYIILPQNVMDRMQTNEGMSFTRCFEVPLLVLKMHTYIHLKHAELLPRLEAGMRQAIQENGLIEW